MNSTTMAVILIIMGLIAFFVLPRFADRLSGKRADNPGLVKLSYRVGGGTMIAMALYIYFAKLLG